MMKCEKCSEFRELPLHLHELYMFCDLLRNKSDVYKLSKKELKQETEAHTESIAKWLKLASQLDNVQLNPFRYEEAHYWCESAGDELDSDASHNSSIITPLTRFLFISNALEETYRFTNSQYEFHYARAQLKNNSLERKRNYSAQAAWLLDEVYGDLEVPLHYDHKVDGYLAQVKEYQKRFDNSFDIQLENNGKLSFGLSLVRNIRNHIAHGVFPIVDNPEYNHECFNPKTKNLILNILGFSSRIATMNIQIILNATHHGFESEVYRYLCGDPDFGHKLEQCITPEYLQRLHLKQDFGLNESSQWAIRSTWEEEG